MVRRTKEEAQETRNRILSAAERIFYERGVAQTTLEHVARAAGVTRGAIYWHFKNKADLFSAMHEAVRMPMQDVFYRIIDQEGQEEDALERLEAFCAASVVELHENERMRRVFGVLLLKCEFSAELEALMVREQESKREVIQALTQFFARTKAAGRLAAGADPRVLAMALYAYMLGLYTDYLRDPEGFAMPGDAQRLLAHFFASLPA